MAKVVKRGRPTSRRKRSSWMNDIPKVARAIVEVYASELPRGKKLDFSEGSIATVDQLISSLWGNQGPSEENLDSMIWGFGCYVAEVLQRHFDGIWKDGIDGYSFEGASSGVGVSPWNWVESRFELGSGDSLASKYRLAKKLMSKDKK